MDHNLTSNPSHTPGQRHSRWMMIQMCKDAHKKRCRTLPAIRLGEAEHLVAAFIAARGVTQCPPAYVAAVQ
jgi:hypothetical protein